MDSLPQGFFALLREVATSPGVGLDMLLVGTEKGRELLNSRTPEEVLGQSRPARAGTRRVYHHFNPRHRGIEPLDAIAQPARKRCAQPMRRNR